MCHLQSSNFSGSSSTLLYQKRNTKSNILSKKIYLLITIIFIVNIQTIQMKIFQYSL